MAGEAVVLRPLRVADEREALRAHDELQADGFAFLVERRVGEPWPEYVRRLECERLGIDLPAGWVASTFLVAQVDAALIGRVSVRHELNDFLASHGGHVGYAVRPAYRRRGYATSMLRQALVVAAAVGVRDVLVTCDVDNVGSARVIERCGGRFDGIAPACERSPAKRRYWIRTGGS